LTSYIFKADYLNLKSGKLRVKKTKVTIKKKNQADYQAPGGGADADHYFTAADYERWAGYVASMLAHRNLYSRSTSHVSSSSSNAAARSAASITRGAAAARSASSSSSSSNGSTVTNFFQRVARAPLEVIELSDDETPSLRYAFFSKTRTIHN
jgi:hypothetical protein